MSKRSSIYSVLPNSTMHRYIQSNRTGRIKTPNKILKSYTDTTDYFRDEPFHATDSTGIDNHMQNNQQKMHKKTRSE